MAQSRRVKFVCVVCHKHYDPQHTRAEWKGLCSMACQHALARECGYRKNKDPFRTEYAAMADELRRRRLSLPGAEPVEFSFKP